MSAEADPVLKDKGKNALSLGGAKRRCGPGCRVKDRENNLVMLQSPSRFVLFYSLLGYLRCNVFCKRPIHVLTCILYMEAFKL